VLRRLVALTALGLATLGCSTSSAPATAPSNIAPGVTTTTTTALPATTSTTVDPVAARRAEIEQIIQDVEFRYLLGLYERDEALIRSAFASRGYYENSLANRPDSVYDVPAEPKKPEVFIDQLLVDSGDCISVRVTIDFGPAFENANGTFYTVYETRMDETWGLSFVGTGYGCINDHPFGVDRL
jgi:hypothetical protein